MTDTKPHVDLRRYTPDGNAFLVLGRARKSFRESGASETTVQAFMDEAMERDYQSLVDACHKYLVTTDSSTRPDQIIEEERE